jgi:hypothetical protein
LLVDVPAVEEDDVVQADDEDQRGSDIDDILANVVLGPVGEGKYPQDEGNANLGDAYQHVLFK